MRLVGHILGVQRAQLQVAADLVRERSQLCPHGDEPRLEETPLRIGAVRRVVDMHAQLGHDDERLQLHVSRVRAEQGGGRLVQLAREEGARAAIGQTFV